MGQRREIKSLDGHTLLTVNEHRFQVNYFSQQQKKPAPLNQGGKGYHRDFQFFRS